MLPRFFRIIGFIMMLVVAASCNQPAAIPTLTFSQEGCIYSGPNSLPARFELTWTIEESDHSAYIYALVTLEEGKTVQDLAGMPGEDPPPAWVRKLNYSLEVEPGTYTQTIDLGVNAAYDGRPVYLVCFFADQDNAVGAAGPIDIKN